MDHLDLRLRVSNKETSWSKKDFIHCIVDFCPQANINAEKYPQNQLFRKQWKVPRIGILLNSLDKF